MKKSFIIVFVLILATLFNWFIACKKSSTLPTTPKDPLDYILGTYMGIVHYTYYYSSTYYPSSDSLFDTTYSFTLIVSKVLQDTFTINTSYTTCYFNGSPIYGHFGYNSSNVYEVNYYPCADTHGDGWGTLKFSPTLDSAWYNVRSLDEEGGGTVFSLSCTETFSGKKM